MVSSGLTFRALAEARIFKTDAFFLGLAGQTIRLADMSLSLSLSLDSSRFLRLEDFFASFACSHLTAVAYKSRTFFLEDFFASILSSFRKDLLEKLRLVPWPLTAPPLLARFFKV
jgi:hypothetical protein